MASAGVDLSGDLQVIVKHLDASDLSMCADRRQLSPRERSVLCNLNRSALSTTIHLQLVVYNPHRVTSSLLLGPCHIEDLVPRFEAPQCFSLPHSFRDEPLDRRVVEL